MKRLTTLTNYSLAIALLLIIYSCKKTAVNATTPVNLVSAKTTDANAVAFSVASGVARHANKSSMIPGINSKANSGATVKTLTRNLNAITGLPLAKQILDSLAVPDSVNPSYYIFNYVDGGYAVVSADLRVEPILAYSQTGYFPHSGKLNGGLVNWLTINHKNMQLLKSHPELTIPRGVKILWNELLPAQNTTPQSTTYSIVRGSVAFKAAPPPPTCEPTSSTVTVGPLVQTTWAQGYPYDLLCKVGTYSTEFYGLAPGRVPAGCVATAMAQVMYYWQYPSTYNWSIMPLTSNTTSGYASNMAVAQLMYDIGLPTNQGGVGMSYSNGGSDADVSNCTAVFKNTYHYSSAAYGNFDYNTVISNLNSGEPVILSGATGESSSWIFWTNYTGGHAWVCDGYDQTTSTWCASPGQPAGGDTYLLFDMNWGWNEVLAPNVDGWYDFNLWEVYNNGPGGVLENYQYSQEMNYNIHP